MKKVILKNGSIGFYVDVKNVITQDEFNYMLLSRLISDLDYFLGYGNKSIKHLWAVSIKDQFLEINKIYNNISIKPIWLTRKQILNYKKMCSM